MWKVCENKPIDEYVDFPINGKDVAHYIGGDTLGFDFTPKCDYKDLKITEVNEKVEYYWDERKNLADWQWHCNFRIVEVKYEVSCSNKLIYSGVKYLFSNSWHENGINNKGTDFKKQAHDWASVPLSFIYSDSSRILELLNLDSLKKAWNGQSVDYPPFYLGEPGKLPRPVLLIHGIESDFKIWDVAEIIDDRKDSTFKNGLVKGYNIGSLPDLLSKAYGLDTSPKNINSNGVYFYQAPGKEVDGEWHEDSLAWNAVNSQSKYLYKKIEYVLDNYFKEDWRKNETYKIDLVAHSQGALLIREMLKGLHNDGSYPQGVENAANRINRVVSVNTPHFGSSLAVDNANEIAREYPGLALIIEDLDNPKKHSLVEAHINESYVTRGLGAAVSMVLFGGLLGLEVSGVLGAIGVADMKLAIKGPYLGPYNVVISKNSLVEIEIYELDDSSLSEARNYMNTVRSNAKYHLSPNGGFITELNRIREGLFPTRPDGTKITLLPMYSDSSHKILPDIFAMLSEEANRLCAKNDEAAGCFAAGAVFESYAKEMSGFSVSNANISDSLWQALLEIQDGWLKNSDAIVEAQSQKFLDPSKGLSPDNPEYAGYFLEPRNYAFHDRVSPFEAVLHGPKMNNAGATRQGSDLLCALTPACSEKSNINGVPALLQLVASSSPRGIEASAKSVDLQGNFDVNPLYVSGGSQGIALSIGDSLILHAEYAPGKGSFLNGKQILSEQIVTQPSIARNGGTIIVSFNNYSGKYFTETIVIPNLPSDIKLSVLADAGAAMSSLAAGSGSASNPETQKPPSPPPGHRLAPVTLAVLHRETRREDEANTSRPRFLIYNTTKDTLEFSKVAYYFTADPARKPQVKVDYPYVPVSVENLGGDKWRFVFNVGNQKIAPKQFYPSKDGWQVRMYYSDWFDYKHLDDWSADYSIGLPKENRKIVIYDKNGKIIWGMEAPGFESEDNGIIPTPKGTIAWKDDAPWEYNMFKPRVEVKNTGSVALSDYHAQLWFRVPQGKSLFVPSPEDWYTPESQPSAKKIGGRVWMLDMHFNQHILYPGESVSEGNIGLRLTDWSAFDRLVCGVVLRDDNGNILFGKEPSVEECESYNGPSLLLPQYSKK
jgi:hypothetical protein